jgi:hypothetical protein
VIITFSCLVVTRRQVLSLFREIDINNKPKNLDDAFGQMDIVAIYTFFLKDFASKIEVDTYTDITTKLLKNGNGRTCEQNNVIIKSRSVASSGSVHAQNAKPDFYLRLL